TLNTPQLKEDFGKPAPRFLADPHLALDSPPVAKALMNAGMDKISYTAAQKLQRPGLLPMYQAQISHREESSSHTSTSQPTQPHNLYATSTVASVLAQAEESLTAETAALDVYQAHRQMYPDLPTMPPRGLQVALHPASVGKVGGDPLIVTLNTPQLKEDFGKPAPRFLADPHLALDSPPVEKALMNVVVDKDSYTAARELQKIGLLQEYQAQVDRRNESSAHTPPSQPTPPHNPYATSAAAYLPTAPGTGQHEDARAATTHPASGPAWQPFHSFPAAPANRPAPGR
ncbi:hypothetical protein ACFC09_08000, partial [Streptomyces sp. NPDC056161]|uniref:hypothetical protein n=1 Tax=Streptomyces sp. NPDC056161 TaxID=3345732 RepID=UPI0035E00E05